MPKEVKNKTLTERCNAHLELIRTSGTFVSDSGEEVKYSKYCVVVDGAELEVTFDKSVKNMLERFVEFTEVKEA